MSTESRDVNAPAPHGRSAARRVLLSGLAGGAVGLVLGSFVSFAPRVWVIGDRDVSHIVGIGWFVSMWVLMGASVELLPILFDRVVRRK